MSIQRKEFIQKLFLCLEDEKYLLLKYTQQKLDEIEENSDLDILIAEKHWRKIERIAKEEEKICRLSCQSKKSMSQLFLHFEDGGFLQIDCLFYLVRKNLIYLSNDYLFAQQKTIGNIKTYSNFCLLEHLVLFNQLNYAGLSEQYVQYFESLAKAEQIELLEKFNLKYNLELNTLRELSVFDKVLRMQLVSYLNKQTENKWTSKQINTYYYVLDSMITMWQQRGFLISFSGVDGAGKSTILEATRQLLSEKFRRKTVVLRHRPSILPILSSFIYGKAQAEKRCTERLPRQGTNNSSFKSYLRFSYYLLDYLIGRSYVFFRYQLRNYVVLYDRYYFDFIVDPKRSNLALGSYLPKSLYRFIQKPSLNFFLYAPAEIILSRKQELSASVVDALTNNYKALFGEFSEDYEEAYIALENIEQEATLAHISAQLTKLI